MGITFRTDKARSSAATGKMGAEDIQVTVITLIHKRNDTVNSKANQHRQAQRLTTTEPQREKPAVPTPAQKRALSDELSAQVAAHVANGGAIVEAKAGETMVEDGCSPMRHLTTAQKKRRRKFI